jgi:antitoxin ParD1/3/4
MNVSLTPELEAFINQQVESGRYRSASEAVRASIRLLQDHFEERELRLKLLEQELAIGIEQLDAGEGIPAERAFAEALETLDE